MGKVRYMIDGKLLAEKDIYVKEEISKLNVKSIFVNVLRTAITGKS